MNYNDLLLETAPTPASAPIQEPEAQFKTEIKFPGTYYESRRCQSSKSHSDCTQCSNFTKKYFSPSGQKMYWEQARKKGMHIQWEDVLCHNHSPYSDKNVKKRALAESQAQSKPINPLIAKNPEVECCVCMCDNCDVISTCGHYFHKKCMDKWLVQTRNCPFCRHPQPYLFKTHAERKDHLIKFKTHLNFTNDRIQNKIDQYSEMMRTNKELRDIYNTWLNKCE